MRTSSKNAVNNDECNYTTDLPCSFSVSSTFMKMQKSQGILRSKFLSYALIGILNTAAHWTIFGALLILIGTSQASSNLVAFITAVTMSFFLNAKFTFKKQATTVRYFLFMPFMALVSYATGWLADITHTPPIFTLIVFSCISLILGYVYSSKIAFRGPA